MVDKDTDWVTIGIVGIIIIIIGIFLVVGLGKFVPSSGIGSGKATLYKITCRGEIHQPWFGFSKITKYDCIADKAGWFSFAEQPLLLAQKGDLILQLDGRRATKDWSCGIGKYCDFEITLKAIPEGAKGELKLLDKDGNVRDRKSVSV